MVTVINRFLCVNKLDFVFQLSYFQVKENTEYLMVLSYPFWKHSGKQALWYLIYIIAVEILNPSICG